MTKFKIIDTDTEETWYRESRAEAEQDIAEFGDMRDLELEMVTEQSRNGDKSSKQESDNSNNDSDNTSDEIDRGAPEQKLEPDVIDNMLKADNNLDQTNAALNELDENIDTDPLDILPDYMTTLVDGEPSLNKRGVSVLAYHYNIDVTDKETIAYPHETDYTAAIVEIEVTGDDGRTFVGAGEAHADETPKHQLLRMAETRAYKRAVIFATGTGIVGYQELMEELQ